MDFYDVRISLLEEVWPGLHTVVPDLGMLSLVQGWFSNVNLLTEYINILMVVFKGLVDKTSGEWIAKHKRSTLAVSLMMYRGHCWYMNIIKLN